MWKLVDGTGQQIFWGTQVVTFRGERCVLTGGRPPHKPASTGRVYVRFPGATGDAEFFPSVVGLEWINTNEEG